MIFCLIVIMTLNSFAWNKWTSFDFHVVCWMRLSNFKCLLVIIFCLRSQFGDNHEIENCGVVEQWKKKQKMMRKKNCLWILYLPYVHWLERQPVFYCDDNPDFMWFSTRQALSIDRPPFHTIPCLNTQSVYSSASFTNDKLCYERYEPNIDCDRFK